MSSCIGDAGNIHAITTPEGTIEFSLVEMADHEHFEYKGVLITHLLDEIGKKDRKGYPSYNYIDGWIYFSRIGTCVKIDVEFQNFSEKVMTHLSAIVAKGTEILQERAGK